MLLENKNKEELFLGIDGGGSKCKAIIMANNKILGSGVSGPGNPIHGFQQATHSIVESTKLALKDAGLSHIPLSDLIAGVGLAGVNLPVLFEQMSAWQHPFKKMSLTTDLLIACLGAHEGKDGAVIVSGTGSCAFSCVEGQYFSIGGHGFPHGDEASGAWFGMQAAKNVLLSIDGVIAPSLMNNALLRKLDCKNEMALVEAIAGKSATYFAKIAHVVFDAADEDDAIAKSIIAEGAEYIDKVVSLLNEKNPPRLSMLGGLTPRLFSWLDNDIQQQFSTPLSSPEVGAVLFAQQQLQYEINTAKATITG